MLNKTDRRFHWAWLSEHNSILRHDMVIINELLKQVQGNQFVDLGCFIGGFTAAMAKVAKERDGKVFSVDLYKSAITLPGNFYNEHMNYPCKEYFMENMMREGIWPWIELHEGCSWEMADKFKYESVDFIWIDAGHDYQSVLKDIRAWYPKLKKYGIIAGHDYTEPGVELAVKECFNEFTIHTSRNECWSYRKV